MFFYKRRPVFFCYVKASFLSAIISFLSSYHSALATDPASANVDAIKCRELKLSDYQHGEIQLRKMLKAHPAMCSLVKEKDWLWIWTAEQFAGKHLNTRIYWGFDNKEDCQESLKHDSWSREVRDGKATVIVNARGMPMTAEKLWSLVVYELISLRSMDKMKQLVHKAERHEISKEKFIMEEARVQFSTITSVKRFYRGFWMPHMEEVNATSSPSGWYSGTPATFEQWIAYFTDRTVYPWSTFGELYRLASNGKANFYTDNVLKPHVFTSEGWRELTFSDYVYGEEQLRKMLSSRPEMSKLVKERDWVWIWTAEQFAGTHSETRVRWGIDGGGGTKEWFNYDSWYRPFRNGRPAAIIVNTLSADGQLMCAEKLWSLAVYELINLRSGMSVNNLVRRAERHNISKENFAREGAKIEFGTVHTVIWFYNNVWVPHMEELNVAPSSSYWYAGTPDRFDEWITLFSDKKGYPWAPYGEMYDGIGGN